jgi:large subunit ribosomal protein L25
MTKVNPILNAEVRTIFGRKVRQLRRKGLIPSTIYGKDIKPISIQAVDKELEHIFSEVGESGLVEIMIDGQKYPILFKNPQYDPMVSNLVHIDCHKVNLKEKIIATVPVELIGESSAVKFGNVLVEVTNEVEVEALPADLPEKIEVDISGLSEVGATITVADLVIDKKLMEIKTDAEQVIVKIEEPRAEEVEVASETEVAPGEVPATEQKTPEEIAAADAKAKEEKKEKE